MSRSLRDYLAELDAGDQLVRIGEAVGLDGDAAAVLSLLEGGPAVLLEDVGRTMPVLGNVVTSRERIAAALDVPLDGISDALLDAIANPVPTREVHAGPVQQHVEPVDLTALPIPRFFERETGPYITAGVILVRDVVSGERNLSFARFKILDERRAMLGVSPNHHLGKMAKRAADRGEDLPISVALGTHPAITVAACLYLGFGDDELECAGRLMGAPVDVVRSVTNGIPVPADAELVLEGVVRTRERVREGLVSEFHGRYHDYGDGYVVEFTTLSRRADAMFPVIVPGLHQEHVLLGAVSIAAGLRAHLQRIAPNVVEVAVPDSGAGRTAAVVAVRDIRPGQADRLIEAGLSVVSLIKQLVVVDAEVDPWDPAAVEWARLAHARPERDFTIIPGARTDRSDPLVRELTVGKLGIDATAKPGERVEGWEFARVAPDARARAVEVLRRSGVQIQQSSLVAGLRY